MTTCPPCGKEWTGLKMAHCPSCHETFSTVSNFDKHRVGPVDKRACENPHVKGMVQNDKGTWIQEGERDISWIHEKRGGGL